MNKIHEDGHALISLTQKMECTPENNQADAAKETKPGAEKKPTPPPSVQRQDTDYDVKPSIKKPKPTDRDTHSRPHQANAGHQFHAAAPDAGGLLNATQMGESEEQYNDDAHQFRTKMLRSICN